MRWVALLLIAVALAGCGARAKPPDTWRAVLNDWYDNGTFDRQHSCAAVRAARAHLPPDPPMFSTVYRDLQREERHVCSVHG
jgi:hypothetical protein